MLLTPLILYQCITVVGLGVTLPECCLMFVTGRVTLERDPTDLANWATTGGDHRASCHATHPALQVPDPADASESALPHREDLTRLDRALAALPVELRECLVPHEREDLSYKEIAHVTGVPIETVMSQLWRTRGALMPGQAQGATP